MHIFEYSRITEGIPSDIVDTLLSIERIRAFDNIRIGVYGKELDFAKDITASRNAASTNRMETGAPDCKTIGQSVEETATRDPVLAGCLNMYSELAEPFDMDVDEGTLLHMHRTITNGITRRDSRFRLRDGHDEGDDEPRIRAMKPLSAESVKTAMDQMLSSYNAANDVGVLPLLLSPCLIVDFLNVHPFNESNWRISRALLQMLLLRGGFHALRYVSLDSRISDSAEDYYDALSESSSGWRSNESDPFPFIRYISEAVLDCYREFDARYPLDRCRKMQKSDRVPSVLGFTDRPMTKSEIHLMLPDMSKRTMDMVLTELVKDGEVMKIGSYKDARYVRNTMRKGA